jgi:hypothetical protein
LGMHHIPYNHSHMLSPKPYQRPLHGLEDIWEYANSYFLICFLFIKLSEYFFKINYFLYYHIKTIKKYKILIF